MRRRRRSFAREKLLAIRVFLIKDARARTPKREREREKEKTTSRRSFECAREWKLRGPAERIATRE